MYLRETWCPHGPTSGSSISEQFGAPKACMMLLLTLLTQPGRCMNVALEPTDRRSGTPHGATLFCYRPGLCTNIIKIYRQQIAARSFDHPEVEATVEPTRPWRL